MMMRTEARLAQCSQMAVITAVVDATMAMIAKIEARLAQCSQIAVITAAIATPKTNINPRVSIPKNTNPDPTTKISGPPYRSYFSIISGVIATNLKTQTKTEDLNPDQGCGPPRRHWHNIDNLRLRTSLLERILCRLVFCFHGYRHQ